LRAFARTPEYAGYPWRMFKEAAAKYFARFFGNVRGTWSVVSVVAQYRGELIGAALVKQRQSGALLDCLFVAPEQARQGWATAMMVQVVQNLSALGERSLLSHVHLANEASLAWHLRFGFREIPDLWIAEHRWRTYAAEVERCHRLNRYPKIKLAHLKELETYWLAEAERLHDLERRDFCAAHPHFD